MLRVQIDYRPFGRGGAEIGALEITNDATHHLRPDYGNYLVVAYDKGGEGIAETRVLDHRRADGAWQLIAMAANAVAAALRTTAMEAT